MTSKRTIYVEATALLREKKTGIDYYAQGLIGELARQMPDAHFICFAFDDVGDNLSIEADNVTFIKIKRGRSKIFRLKMLLGIAPPLERLLNIKRVDTVIFPNFYSWPVRTSDAKIYPIIHDTTYIDCPEYVDRRNRMLLRKLVRSSAMRATKIITISKSSMKSLQNNYGRPESDYVVAYPAPAPSSEKVAVKRPLNVPKNYFLYLGTLEPRKNVENIIRAHLSLPATIRKKYPLILAGGKGWKDESILNLIEKYTGNCLQYLGRVTDVERGYLYNHAFAFVYPAKMEGFGMPVVEALAAGLPVITSNNSSLPEAGGKSAFYCDGTINGIADSMMICIQDKARGQRIKEGKLYANTFSWRDSAKMVKRELGRK